MIKKMNDLDKMAAEYMGIPPEWSPSTNISHARMLLEALQEKGVSVDITLTHIDTAYVELSHPDWDFVVSDENELLETAITKASIMAFWVMEDD